MPNARNRYYLLVLLLSVAAGIWYANTRRFGHDWGDDFSQYIHHAQNIATGQPYKAIGHILNPDCQISPEVYPPLFPLLLAPVVTAVGPWDLAALKLVGIGCLMATLLVWGWSLTQEARAEQLPPTEWPTHLLPLLGLLAVCPTVWELKDNVLSDVPYLLMQTIALAAIGAFRGRRAATTGRRLGAAIGLGVALWLPYGCRTTGFVLVGAFALETVWRHRRNLLGARLEALALGVTVALVLLQGVYLDSHDSGYTKQLLTYFSLDQIKTNALLYWNLAIRYWGEQPGLGSDGYRILGTAAALLVLLGWVRRWREGAVRTEEIYFLGYLLIVILWPMPQGERFLLPLLPLALLYGWRGARHLPGGWGQYVPTAIASVLLLTGVSAIGRAKPIAWQIDTADTHTVFRWIKWQPSDIVFLAPKPRALSLYTEHRAMAPCSVTDSVVIKTALAYSHARYLLTGPDPNLYLPKTARVVLQTPSLLIIDYQAPPPR